MIDKLHNLINNIVPIVGLSYNYSDNTCDIHYENPDIILTSEQASSINTLISQWPLERAKFLKLEKLDNEWKQNVTNGWVTPYGWKLGLDTQDVTLLTGVFMLAKEAHSLGLNQPSYIVDTDGVSHEISLLDLTNLMLLYGQARSLLSQQYSTKMNSIKQALSIEELDSII